MPSTLGYALLGLLARRPRTGYELSQALRAPIGYFWTASHSQVYPELERLSAEHLVRHRVVEGPGPRDNKRYSITAAGRRDLAEWAVRPARPEHARNEFLLKVYSLWLAAPDRARALVEQQRDAHRATLGQYEQIAAELSAEPLGGPGDPRFYDYASVRRGVAFERHAIAWCEWLLAELGAGAS